MLRATSVGLIVCLAFVMNTTGLQSKAVAQDAFQYQFEKLTVPPARADEPRIPLSVKAASSHLDDGATAWSNQRNCVSCHTNGSYLFIRPALTPSLGLPDQKMREFFVSQFSSLSQTSARKLRNSGTRPAQVIYIAAGLAEWDRHVTRKLSPETDQALRLAFDLQNKAGTWYSLTCWPPFESSAYQEAHMAAMAIGTAPGWLESVKEDDELQAKITKLRSYLNDTTPPHDYARVLKLWTSLRFEGILSESARSETVELLRSRQKEDGGWSIRDFATPEQWGGGNRAEKIRKEPDFAAPPSDGHMTGLSLIVLQEAGVPSTDTQVQQGLQWLRENQRQSGRWWTRSLNTESWHFITYSGTAYALLALQNAETPKR